MQTILLISPYWQESHRWMVSSVKLATLWQRLGYRVIVVCMGRSAGGERVEKRSDTLEVHWLSDVFLRDPWNYGTAFGFSGYVCRLAAKVRPHAIVVNKVLFWSSLALLRLRLSGFRVLLITDALVGMTWWPRPRIAKVAAAIYAWTLGWLILRCATKIVFFHPQPDAILRKLGIAQKSAVIPTGIDLADFENRALHRSQSTEHSSPLTVTYVGRLESVKGADDFVSAALKVKRERPALTIQVVGWYSEGHPLVMRHEDTVTFTGLRKDIPAILATTDIFVLPSYAEGLSNALMEAMASGCACVASDVGGNRFLIENGVSGLLFPAGDTEALASHIRRLADDPAKRLMLGKKARKRIEDCFSWETVGERYRRLFEGWVP